MSKLPKGIKKYIRREKARVRRDFLDIKEQEEKIKLLYESLGKWYKNKFLDNLAQ